MNCWYWHLLIRQETHNTVVSTVSVAAAYKPQLLWDFIKDTKRWLLCVCVCVLLHVYVCAYVCMYVYILYSCASESS